MKNILVTGGAGFIGAHFILHVLSEYDDIKVVNYDKLTYAADLSNLNSVKDDVRYSFIEGDICDYQITREVIEENDIDTIVNFAAESHVDNSIEDSKIFAETNIMGVLNLLKSTKEVWGNGYSNKKFVQISTDEVYGSSDNAEIFDETSKLSPGNPYAASKAAADMMCLAWHNTYGFPVLITRSSNNFGPFQHGEKFIPTVINCALQGKSIPIYGDGQNVRDWIYVKDNVKAIDTVIKKGGLGEIYNISAQNSYRNIDLAKRIIDIVKNEHNFDITYNLLAFVEDRLGHDRSYSISTDKFISLSGRKIECFFDEHLEEVVDWYFKKHGEQ